MISDTAGGIPSLEWRSSFSKEESLHGWFLSVRNRSGSQRGARGRAVWNYIYHCGFLQWSHLVPGEADAACPSARQMRGLLPRGQRGWSRGRGHRRQREGTRPLLLSLLHTLWREMKSKRDYIIVPPSTTLTPKLPEDVLKGAPGCVRVCARMRTHVYVCARMHACVCAHACMCACRHACMCVLLGLN